MRTDLLVSYYVKQSIKNNEIKIYEPQFRRNFIHIRDVVRAIIFSINYFNKLKGNVYNLGLSNANITKLELAKKVKRINPKTIIKIINNKKDLDQRDYFVNNIKFEKTGFKPSFSLDQGIRETYKCLLLNNNYKDNY
jgi:nucleoside-diphosphate-sugar epimerase